MIKLTDVLVRPVVTEKTVAMKGKYTFVVHPDAVKEDVQKALKEFYGVDAVKVNMTNLPEKNRLVGRGRSIKRRSFQKKATVTLAAGKSLDFNAFK